MPTWCSKTTESACWTRGSLTTQGWSCHQLHLSYHSYFSSLRSARKIALMLVNENNKAFSCILLFLESGGSVVGYRRKCSGVLWYFWSWASKYNRIISKSYSAPHQGIFKIMSYAFTFIKGSMQQMIKRPQILRLCRFCDHVDSSIM